jgi:hypothetical protein
VREGMKSGNVLETCRRHGIQRPAESEKDQIRLSTIAEAFVRELHAVSSAAEAVLIGRR